MPRVVLISTYDLGRSPFGLASPAAWLRAAGCEVRCCDLSVEPLDEDAVRAADFVAFHLPMHMATRLALAVIPRVRELAPSARLAAYGLYAATNAAVLREYGVPDAISGEYEAELTRLALAENASDEAEGPNTHTHGTAGDRAITVLDRLDFLVPDRSDLPPIERFARLRLGAEEKLVGATEASRGCKHRCRHCPVVPVYDGLFRVVPREVVLADIRQQVAAGAEHITFGDPDFFNGIGHALPLVRAFHTEFPHVTYDVTIKVEHLLRHAEALPVLRDTGCAFIVTAVEAFDDGILDALEKGHTRCDFERALALGREVGVTLQPTFVAFTPWTTLTGYGVMLEALATLDLIEHVAPVQLWLRLLLPAGSRLLERDDVLGWIDRFDPRALVHRWCHPDPRVDALQRAVQGEVERRTAAGENRTTIFRAVAELAEDFGAGTPRLRAALEASDAAPQSARRAPVPYLTEPWYC
ncbi:MAG: CUAEP/CCAEP-tail radical SAM protein [Candidatus Eisenbacteria bacterium]